MPKVQARSSLPFFTRGTFIEFYWCGDFPSQWFLRIPNLDYSLQVNMSWINRRVGSSLTEISHGQYQVLNGLLEDDVSGSVPCNILQ